MNFRNKVYERYRQNKDRKKYAGKVYLTCCVGVEYDLDLLGYSVDYYKGLGVDELFYILNTTDENSANLKEGIKILDRYPDIHKSIWIGKYLSLSKEVKMKDALGAHVNDNDWIITVDVDEFHDFPMGLRELITICEERNYHCVGGKFVDRISKDGKLKKIDKSKSLWEQYPIDEGLCAKYYINDSKVLLRKNYITLSTGHHFPIPMIEKYLIYPKSLDVHHFRWRDKLINKLEKRIEISKKFGKIYCPYAELMFDYYAVHGTLL